MQLYGEHNYYLLKEHENPTVRFFMPMLKEGVKSYIRNIQTRVYILKYADLYLPITVNQKEYDNPYVVSNYYPIAHLCEKGTYPKKLLYQIGGLGLKAIKINKVVILGNWLLSTNPMPYLAAEAISEITQFLARQFSQHVISVRSLSSEEAIEYESCDYSLFKAREAYFYDGKAGIPKQSKGAYHRRRDLKLLETFTVYDTVQPSQFDSLIDLYSKIYIQKHTRYSPHYTPKFLRHALDSGLLNIKAIKKENSFEGVFGYWETARKMAIPFFGYDNHKSFHQDSYRLLTTLALMEAENKGLLLNDGTGGDYAKMARGLVKKVEYAGLYAKHLPIFRKKIWDIADYFTTSPTKNR
jgi:hypothetical protein